MTWKSGLAARESRVYTKTPPNPTSDGVLPWGWELTTDHLQLATLGSFHPARQVLFLLGRQAVDLDAHRLEFELRHALIKLHWHGVDRFLQAGMVLDHVFD